MKAILKAKYYYVYHRVEATLKAKYYYVYHRVKAVLKANRVVRKEGRVAGDREKDIEQSVRKRVGDLRRPPGHSGSRYP